MWADFLTGVVELRLQLVVLSQVLLQLVLVYVLAPLQETELHTRPNSDDIPRPLKFWISNVDGCLGVQPGYTKGNFCHNQGNASLGLDPTRVYFQRDLKS